MSRGIVALLALSALVGFAPAPFPRERGGERPELSLAACQGTWEIVRKETITPRGKQPYSWHVTHIRILDDRWTLLDRDGKEVASYTLEVGSGRVAPIDWYSLNGNKESPLWGGLVRRDGGHLLILYSDGNRRGEKRQRDIESAPSGSHLITVRKSR
jgi:hypothetical protein